MPVPVPPSKRLVRYFVSYTRKDGELPDKLLAELEKNFSASKDYEFKRWQDTQVLLGEKWHAEIQAAAKECDFSLLLVSPAFLGNPYIGEHELPKLMNGEKLCMPVGLCHIDLEDHDLKGLEETQIFLHAPPPATHGRSFAECTPDEVAKFATALFKQITARLRKSFENASKPKSESNAAAMHEDQSRGHYVEQTITDPRHWDKLHGSDVPFDHRSSNRGDVLSQVRMKDFQSKTRVKLQKDFSHGLTPSELFRRFNFIEPNGNVCNGAFLSFGDEPCKSISGATTKCFLWKGLTGLAGTIDDHESRGGLLEQFEEAMNFLKKSLRLSRIISEEGRTDDFEIPVNVLEEVVANALVHRDYEATNGSVHISIYDDRIEVASPGHLLPPLEIENLSAITISVPRNPQIARIFYLSGVVERAAKGIERVHAALEAKGLPPPEFKEGPHKSFVVVLKRPISSSTAQTQDEAATPVTSHHLQPAILNNLPRSFSFFGREKELQTIAKALLPQTRTWGVLIDGPGGMGKTSLAVRAAELATAQFDRVLFVSTKNQKLTPDGSVAVSTSIVPAYLEVLSEIAQLLGLAHGAEKPEAERAALIKAAMEKKKSLLILDNLENLEKAQQSLLFEFVQHLPEGCKAIVTSRRRSDIDARIIRLEKLEQEAALEFLGELAADRPLLFKATHDERLHLYEETGGNPLLLRWVVGQLGRGSCRSIPAALELCRKAGDSNDPLEFIFGDLLETFTEAETKVLAALAHFTQKIEVKHIAELAELSKTAAQTAVGDLANRALVIPDETEDHFALVPMVGDFLRRTRPNVVWETGRRLEQRAYALIVENGDQNHARFPVLDAAWPSVAPAIPLFLAGSNKRLQRVCDALHRFLDFTGRWDEWLALNTQAEQKAVAEGDDASAGWRAFQAGWAHFLRNQADAVLACAERAAAHWEKAFLLGMGEKSGIRERAEAIRLRGMGQQLKQDYPAAIATYRAGVELDRSLSTESVDVASGLNSLAEAERLSGDLTAAERNYREALRVARAVGYTEGIATYTGNLANLALTREDWAKAEVLAEESLALSQKVGRQELIALNCGRIAKALVQQGRGATGLSYARRAVEIFERLGSPDLAIAQETLAKCEAAVSET